MTSSQQPSLIIVSRAVGTDDITLHAGTVTNNAYKFNAIPWVN
jgi:hypothetical protein